LAKLGWEVHFFTRRAIGQPEYMYINGVHYHTCLFDPGGNSLAFAYNMSKAMVRCLREVERYMGKFNLVHGHDWLLVDALHELKGDGYPIVLSFHSTEYGRHGGVFGDWWEFKEISGKEWYGGYIADRVTTVSHYMRDELNRLYRIPLDKVDVIPNGIDPDDYRLKVDPGRIKEKYGIHPLAPVILFTGRLVYQKGPDLLVEAIPKVLANRWDARFIFAGEGDMKDHLEARARELGVAQSTTFLGYVPHWEYLELLNSSDILCFPSRNEPFGLVLLEAWAAGKPVVASDVGGLGENIENFTDGIKVYVNPDSVAWGINYLLNSPEAMRKIAEGGAAKVKNFEWKILAGKLKDTYLTVLKGR